MANPAAGREANDTTGAKILHGFFNSGGSPIAAIFRIVNAALINAETTVSGALAVAAQTVHDAADPAAEGPVKIGFKASATAPADVADNDRVNGWALRNGAQVIALQSGGALVGIADDAAYTPGTSVVIPVGFEADESGTDSVDEGDAGAGRMTLDRKQIVVSQAHTAGGATPYTALSTAAVLNPEIKGSPGQVYGIQAFNNGASEVFIRIYNQTGAPGTGDAANIVWRGMIPGNTAAAGFVVAFPVGIPCGTGIGIRVSAAVADNDNTSLTANEVMVNVQYK